MTEEKRRELEKIDKDLHKQFAAFVKRALKDGVSPEHIAMNLAKLLHDDHHGIAKIQGIDYHDEVVAVIREYQASQEKGE